MKISRSLVLVASIERSRWKFLYTVTLFHSLPTLLVIMKLCTQVAAADLYLISLNKKNWYISSQSFHFKTMWSQLNLKTSITTLRKKTHTDRTQRHYLSYSSYTFTPCGFNLRTEQNFCGNKRICSEARFYSWYSFS